MLVSLQTALQPVDRKSAKISIENFQVIENKFSNLSSKAHEVTGDNLPILFVP